MSNKLRVNLICWNNGVGLTRDMHLLSRGLREAGFDVHLSPIGRGKLRKWFRPALMRFKSNIRKLLRQSPRFDANIMLEHIREEDIGAARMNLFIPNPEWCLPKDVALLSQVDALLTKTEHAAEIFSALGCRHAHIGFTSDDRLDTSVARERAFFHLAGRSSNKGTDRLIALWKRHPEWPMLTIVQSHYTAKVIDPPAANIDHRIDYLDDAELRRLQNAHWFHLCPSETEGFGHYLVEAMSVGAVAVTTDAPPMNEMVDGERGVLVGYAHRGKQNLADTYYFDESAMEQAVERLLSAPDEELQVMGQAARRWYLKNCEEFARKLAESVSRSLAVDR